MIGLFALVYGIVQAGQSTWTEPSVLVAFGLAAVVLALFAFWESRTPQPMLPLRFFRNPSFTGANAAVALLTFSLFGAMFFLSQFFQSVQGYTALETGVRLLPMALTAMIGAGLSARLSGRFGVKLIVSLGLLLAAGGFYYMAVFAQADVPYTTALVGLCITALGIGLAMPVATDSIMGSVPVDKAGVGSAMNDTTRMIGGALGIAILGTIMNRTYLTSVNDLLSSNLLFRIIPAEGVDAIRASIQGAHIVADQLPVPALATTLKDTASAAFVTGMTDALVVGTGILLVAALITLVILPSRVRTWAETVGAPPESVAPETASLQHSR